MSDTRCAGKAGNGPVGFSRTLTGGSGVWGKSGNPRALLFVRLPRVSPARAVSEEQQLSFIYLGFPSLPGGKWCYVGVSAVCVNFSSSLGISSTGQVPQSFLVRYLGVVCWPCASVNVDRSVVN